MTAAGWPLRTARTLIRSAPAENRMLKRWPHAAAAALAALSLAGCGAPLESDPIYQALKANPPTSVPANKRAELRKGHSTCDLFNEGQPSKQYMLCWWPSGGPSAHLSYYAPSPISPPHPSKLITPGGEPITPFIKFQ